MNSVLQVLWSLPSVRARYGPAAAPALFASAPADPAADLPTQARRDPVRTQPLPAWPACTSPPQPHSMQAFHRDVGPPLSSRGLPCPGLHGSRPVSAFGAHVTAVLARLTLSLTLGCVQMAKLGVALVAARTGAPPPPSASAGDTPAAANGAQPMDTDTGPPGGAPAGVVAAVTDGEAELRVRSSESRAGASAAGPRPGEETGAGDSVRPQAFKALVGRGHPEFSSGRQQVGACHPDKHLL